MAPETADAQAYGDGLCSWIAFPERNTEGQNSSRCKGCLRRTPSRLFNDRKCPLSRANNVPLSKSGGALLDRLTHQENERRSEQSERGEDLLLHGTSHNDCYAPPIRSLSWRRPRPRSRHRRNALFVHDGTLGRYRPLPKLRWPRLTRKSASARVRDGRNRSPKYE